MARSSRGTPLSWGIVFLAICGLWLILMVSNRSLALPLFFLGRFTVNLPVGFWLFGAFVVGNVVSLGILSFLQWTIVRLAQDFSQGRSGGRFEEIPPRKVGRAAPEPEWEEDEFDWEEPPQRPTPSPSPVQSAQTHQPQPPQTQTQADRIKTDRSPEEGSRNPEEAPDATPVPPLETEGKVYEAPPPPRQGKQEGSSYAYEYRPARRAQEPMDPPSAQSAGLGSRIALCRNMKHLYHNPWISCFSMAQESRPKLENCMFIYLKCIQEHIIVKKMKFRCNYSHKYLFFVPKIIST